MSDFLLVHHTPNASHIGEKESVATFQDFHLLKRFYFKEIMRQILIRTIDGITRRSRRVVTIGA
jgi:hypothetical protein